MPLPSFSVTFKNTAREKGRKARDTMAPFDPGLIRTLPHDLFALQIAREIIAKECLCGNTIECRGFTAAFALLGDRRCGFVELPDFIPSPSSRQEIETNQRRESYLRHLLPKHSIKDQTKTKDVALHHFHPSFIGMSISHGMRLPNIIPEEASRQLQLSVHERDKIVDKHGNPTGWCIFAPNYSIEKIKKEEQVMAFTKAIMESNLTKPALSHERWQQQEEQPPLTSSMAVKSLLDNKPLIPTAPRSRGVTHAHANEVTLLSKVTEFLNGMEVNGADRKCSIEEQSAAVYKRIAILDGASDARPILPLWREYMHVHEMFEFWARVQPHALALEVWLLPDYSPVSVTYKELNEMANRVASKILQLTGGKTTNRVAAIHIPRSAELVIAILGAAKAGMAFAAVDTEELPVERLHFILGDTKSNILLTTRHQGQSPAIEGVHHLYVENVIHSTPSSKVQSSSVPVRPVTDDDDLLALVYTSGSTGQPKGVMLHHGAFANYHAIEQRLAGVTPSDRVVHTQSISFVSGVGEVFRAMCAGATFLMCGTEVRRQGPDLLPWLESKKATIFKAVPSMLRGLITINQANIHHLRLIVASGEACTNEIVNFFAPSVVLINTYGPTETCSNNMFKVCRPDEPITIGIPYPTFKIHLLDENKEVNSKYGQICVHGLSVAKGYLNVDTEAFIQHPTLGRLYLTGDMGEMLPNGEIRYAGRTDAQVKIKGYRIELGEVETKFLKLDCVREAAVIYNDGRLHGFVSLENNRSLKQEEISNFTLVQWHEALLRRGGLGEYALPHSVTVVETMPRTVSGKIDRKKLPLPDVGGSNDAQDPDVNDIDPITSPAELVLLAAFAKVLGRSIVSCDNAMNFFEHGGDSSAAGLLISQLRSCGPRFNTVSVKDLYLNATPIELARVVGSQNVKNNNNVYASKDADIEANLDGTARHATNDEFKDKFSSMYHGKWICLIQFLYFLFVCLMDGAAVRVGIWCLLFSRPWLFSLVGINAEEWGFGIEKPLKMIYIHAVLLYFLFYVVAMMWFWIWFIILFLTKWTLIGVYTPGLKSSRSWFVRNWIIGRIASRIPWSTVYGTPLGNCLLSLLGAKIGSRAYLAIDSRAPIIGGFDCLEIGDDASINHAFVSAISMSPLGVDVGRVRVLDRAIVSPRAILLGQNTLMEDSQLGCLSNMKRGDVIPSGEYWTGSPAVYSHDSEIPPPTAELLGTDFGYIGYYLMRSMYTFMAHLGIGVPLAFTTAVLLFLVNAWPMTLIFVFFILFHIPWGAAIMVIVPALYIKAINYFNDLSSGDYHLYCWQSLLIGLKQGLFAIPQGLLNNTYFLVDWMRWCGAKIGRRSEIARVRGAVPDMMDFGEETFLTNWTHVATPEIRGKALQVGGVKVGNKFLAGNRSVIPINTVMGDDILLGVLSLAPTNAATTHGKTWLGNPAFPFNHPPNDNYPVPTSWEAESRRIWDVIAICTPLTLLGAMSIAWFLLASVFHDKDTIFPYVVHSAAAGFIVRIVFSFLTAKWLYWYFENGAQPRYVSPSILRKKCIRALLFCCWYCDPDSCGWQTQISYNLRLQ